MRSWLVIADEYKYRLSSHARLKNAPDTDAGGRSCVDAYTEM